MKYKIGSYVEYEGEKCLVIGCHEDSAVTYGKDNKVEATVDIFYDLEDECGVILDYIPEIELEDYIEKKKNIILKNGATYKLRNNMKATYEEIGDVIITDEGISIPAHFYDKEGKCEAYPSFDITEELWNMPEEDDDDTMDDWWLDWCDEQSNEEDDECKEISEYPLTLRDDSGKYYITFNKGVLGWTFNGNLPEEIEVFLSKILNGGIN